MSSYIHKNIPRYPNPVEFHITEVTHVTNKTSLLKIWDSEGFKGLEHSFSWWSLKINYRDIREAEERYLERIFPNRSNDEKDTQLPFLYQFTTSPLFKGHFSRYGNFRFTFPLSELMEAYKQQSCEGEEPVLRVYQTKVFKQEIEYVVLIHSPQFNEKFKGFNPLICSPFVDYDGHRIIWKAQAICETHKWQLVTRGKTAEAKPMSSRQFYVWDHVSFVFHTPEGLTFPKSKLKESLSCCMLDPNIKLSRGENCYSIREAKSVLAGLDVHKAEKEDEKSEEIKMEED